MKVENTIIIYEVDDKEASGELFISSHLYLHDFVVIGCGDTKITVSAEDLIKAIKNATNW